MKCFQFSVKSVDFYYIFNGEGMHLAFSKLKVDFNSTDYPSVMMNINGLLYELPDMKTISNWSFKRFNL